MENEYLKLDHVKEGICKHCKKKISYITEIRGLTVICPHCKKAT